MATTNLRDKKAPKTAHAGAPPPEPEPEHLPCPRCDSTNTKFCYYNNYNFSQPRHFCKSCRRYWTHGGTLRDIPIGGGTRKNAKRSRTSGGVSSASAAVHHHDFRQFPGAAVAASPLMVPIAGVDHGSMVGSFTSLLNNSYGGGILALGGFGIGFDEVGFGLGRGMWPFPGVVEGAAIANGNGGGGGPMWRLENGDGGYVGSGDSFTLADLAISTPGSVLK